MNDTSVHEAGHAAMALEVEDERIGEVSLEPEGDAAGIVRLGEAKSHAARVCTILAGPAAAAAIAGRDIWAEYASPSAKSDMDIARELCGSDEKLELCQRLVAHAVLDKAFQGRVLKLAQALELRGRLSGVEVRAILEMEGKESWRL